MMKALIILSLILASTVALGAAEDAPSLEEQLKSLELPSNQAPAGISSEKLYVIQERYLPLKNRFELSAGGGINLTGNSFLNTQQVTGGIRYHLNDRWSLGVAYSFVANKFTDAADRLKNSEGIVPEVAYAKSRAEATVAYNVFYGKFRLSADQVFYFDQYVALGAGQMQLNRTSPIAFIGDAGFVFWLGKWGSVRAGVKDYMYSEPRRSGTEMTHNAHAHLDVGYIF